MKSTQTYICVGHLSADPNVRYTPEGRCSCEITIVLDESFKDESNSVRKRKEYVRAAAFNGIASAIGKIFSKGDLIWIEGRLETRKHDKTIDGVTVPVHSTTVIVQSFKPLNSTQRRKEVDGNKL